MWHGTLGFKNRWVIIIKQIPWLSFNYQLFRFPSSKLQTFSYPIIDTLSVWIPLRCQGHSVSSCWGMEANRAGPLCIQRLLTAREKIQKKLSKERIASCYYTTPGQFRNLQVRYLTKIIIQGYSNAFPHLWIERANKLADLLYSRNRWWLQTTMIPQKENMALDWKLNLRVLLNIECIYLHSK